MKLFSTKTTSQTVASPNLKSHFHARSVSLPSKPNLLIPQAEEHLMRIRSSEATAPVSWTSMTVEGLLLFPDTQHALVQEGREGVLERSLSLLDLCSAIKDVIAQTKENMQELQSTLRRRRVILDLKEESEEDNSNLLKNLKIKSTCSSVDQYGMTTVSMLREVEEVAFRSIESLLTLVHGKLRSCSFFGKLMHSKRLEEVDSADHTFLSHKNGKLIQMEYLQKILAEIESGSQDLEEEVERLIRRLIKTRASLLNILNH
ncbi:hypothetical protein ACJRO7_035065 [Eucalyptus globulus]|uniref:Uncharacterized protein n=1 Tax=Eucalyptus globulus TaxID=34317 RepID=A0ABD3JAK2_EUCGL